MKVQVDMHSHFACSCAWREATESSTETLMERREGLGGTGVGGVSILRTYEEGTKPCFPSSSTFHQSLLAELRRTRMSPLLMGSSRADLPL